MKTSSWEPSAKDYQFIRDELLFMSPQEMADCLKVSIGILNKEKVDMSLTIDDHMKDKVSTSEYELDRWLNRWERALQWTIKHEWLDSCKGFYEGRTV